MFELMFALRFKSGLALDDAPRAREILGANQTRNFNLAEVSKDNLVPDYAGARVAVLYRIFLLCLDRVAV
jgi:hypothetical protein